MNPQSWRPLPGAIEEDEISIKLIWKANRRTRFALERQAKLSQLPASAITCSTLSSSRLAKSFSSRR